MSVLDPTHPPHTHTLALNHSLTRHTRTTTHLSPPPDMTRTLVAKIMEDVAAAPPYLEFVSACMHWVVGTPNDVCARMRRG